MSDSIKHECGIALIRLKKPLNYYVEKYNTPLYGIKRLSIMMQKQYNRGQDGAGVAVLKTKMKPGKRYIARYRDNGADPVNKIFEKIGKKYSKLEKKNPDKINDVEWMKNNFPALGEVYMGHLRYGTHGANSLESCHPFLRQNNWRSRNLILAGNFNMTNVDELFDKLVDIGQHPKEKKDTITVMEKIGHFLDEENEYVYQKYKKRLNNTELTDKIEEEINVQKILQRSCKDFDGGYVMCGIIGHGTTFVARDPNGIRPAYYYEDDEIIAVASERPAIKLAFGVNYEDIEEVNPGHAIIIDRNANLKEKEFIDPRKKLSCSFERIYFSRGKDPEIYKERKMMGYTLSEKVLKEVDYNFDNTVFSYIPNTAETSYFGLVHGIVKQLNVYKKKLIEEGKNLEDVLNISIRTERVITKDAKIRTFIVDDDNRDDIVSKGYDTIDSVVQKGDNLVIVDDSIVRGTTMEKSILRLLDSLNPKKIVIVSASPQIRYPDCYGIDMSRMGDFIAFRAVLELLKETGSTDLLTEVYEKCKASMGLPDEEMKNHVKKIYKNFTIEQITNKIADIIKPSDMKAELKVIYQTIEGLHQACPDHLGDWYFTGNYPTPGGNRVVNKSFMNFMEGKNKRGY
jgi:amidophosphoribosyltransferase